MENCQISIRSQTFLSERSTGISPVFFGIRAYQTENNPTCLFPEPGSGSGSGLVMPSAMVVVKSATTGELVADVSVQLVLQDETMTTTTDLEGRAIFTLR